MRWAANRFLVPNYTTLFLLLRDQKAYLHVVVRLGVEWTLERSEKMFDASGHTFWLQDTGILDLQKY